MASRKGLRRRFGMSGPVPYDWGSPRPEVTYACPRCGGRRVLTPALDPQTRRYSQQLTTYCFECRVETPHRVVGDGDRR